MDLTDKKHKIIEKLQPFAVDISMLRLDPRNARKEHDVEGIAESFDEFGQRQLIVYNADDDNLIEAGEGRLKAAKALGWDVVAAVEVREDRLDASRYSVTDNRLTDASEFDNFVLAQLVKEMRAAGKVVIGWEDDVLDELLAEYSSEPKELGPDEQDPGDQLPADPAAELMQKWGTEIGQVWQLESAVDGQVHRIICGDNTDPAVRDELLELDRVALGLTDPPYGIDLDLSWMNEIDGGRKAKLKSVDKIEGDDGSADISPAFLFDRWIVWGFPYLTHQDMSGWLVWDKWPGLDGESLGNPIEMAFTNVWNGFQLVRVMWGGYYRAAGEEPRVAHPTQKPIGVIRPFIAKHTKPGEIVADLFAGSGTTINACEREGRQCRAAEIDPRFVAVMLERYYNTFEIEGYLL